MKTTILLLITALLTSTAQANSSFTPSEAPQCYGNQEVSPREPFILVLSEMTTYTAEELLHALTVDQLLSINHTMNFSDTNFAFVIAVNNDQNLPADKVNQLVFEHIERTLAVHKIPPTQFVLECNNRVYPNPRAGGMNGN